MNTDKRAIQFRLDRIEELTYSISGNSAEIINQDNLGVQFLVPNISEQRGKSGQIKGRGKIQSGRNNNSKP